MPLNIAIPKIVVNTKTRTVTTSIHIRVAFAKLDLFGLVPEPKAQIINIIKPIRGMDAINKVIIQLVVDSTGAL